MILTSIRIKKADVELLRSAAAHAEISQSEFMREALREKARNVLLSERQKDAKSPRV